MRTSKRLAAVVGATAMATLLAACGSYPMQQQASYPSTPYPATSSYPSSTYPSTAYPSAGVQQSTPVAGVEWGRVTDIQAVSMGANGTTSTNPNVSRAIAGGILGAVVGSVVGKNVNNGHSRSGATVLGGAAGAAIGSGIGRNDPNTASAGAGPAYHVTVQTDQGAWRTYEVGATGDLRVGDRVRIENGVIYRS